MYKNMKSNSVDRILWVDIAKALLIFCIVLCHTLRFGKLDVFLTSFGMPCFFILSGITYRRKSNYELIANKAIRILVPYYIFGIISILFYYFFGKYASSSLGANIKDVSILPNILGMLYGNCKTGYMAWNTPLYYLPLLFIVSVIVNLFENCISSKKDINIYRISFVIISFLLSYYISINNYINLPFYLEGSLFFSSLFEIGIIGKKYYIRDYNPRIMLLISFFLFIIGFFISVYNAPYGLHLFILGKNYFIFILNTIILSTAVILLSKTIKRQRILSIIGRNTLGILCMHKFPVLFFVTVFPYFNNIIVSNQESAIVYILAIIIASFSILLCLMCAYVIILICPYVLGEKYRHNIFIIGDDNASK